MRGWPCVVEAVRGKGMGMAVGGLGGSVTKNLQSRGSRWWLTWREKN